MLTHFNAFSIARLPRIEFGNGSVSRVADIISTYGNRILLITGHQSFDQANWSEPLLNSLTNHKITFERVRIKGEPSPAVVNQAVTQFANQNIQAVLAVGGGSALDAGKAIAGLLSIQQPVEDFLEGVGAERPYPGPAIPFIAVPTTAGTGSEATKNAVLSVHGKNGYKKSFRDDALVAEVAIIDPDLLASCSTQVIAANGMDALTQLIESYVSIKTNVFTDALGISGLRAARDGLLPLFNSQGTDKQARERMAYASLVSGINLAQTGLGSVHGLASPLGAFYPIPHGVVCGTLVGVATEININAMRAREADNIALARYARVSEVLHRKRFKNREDALTSLVKLLNHWTNEMKLEKLSGYGIKPDDFDHIVKHSRGSSMKTNPIVLNDEEIKNILQQRL